MNRPLEELTHDFIRQCVKAVVFDVDGVIMPTGTFLRENIDGTELIIRTHKPSAEMLRMVNELKKHVTVLFSSGRALLYLQHMLEDILWDNVTLIAENGNFILIDGKVEQIVSYDSAYFQKLTDIRAGIKRLQKELPERIHGFEPKHLILSVHTEGELPEIPALVQKWDGERELYCLWTNEGYDIGRKWTDKGSALRYFSERSGIPAGAFVTSGNNLNDREMLAFGVGVSVDPDQVAGMYAVPKREGEPGGETLARHLLNAFTH